MKKANNLGHLMVIPGLNVNFNFQIKDQRQILKEFRTPREVLIDPTGFMNPRVINTDISYGNFFYQRTNNFDTINRKLKLFVQTIHEKLYFLPGPCCKNYFIRFFLHIFYHTQSNLQLNFKLYLRTRTFLS